MNERWRQFCEQHHYLYIYGAGSFGRKVLTILKEQHIDICGFLETNPVHSEYLGFPVFCASEIKDDRQNGIILAIKNIDTDFFKSIKGDVLQPKNEEVLENYFDIVYEKVKWNRYINKEVCKNKIKNVLVSLLKNGMGDVVCSTAFLRELRRGYPDAEIWVLIQKKNYHILKNCPYVNKILLLANKIDNLYSCNLQEIISTAEEFWESEKNEEGFDIAFLLYEMVGEPCDWADLIFSLIGGARKISGYVAFSSPEKQHYIQKLQEKGIKVFGHRKPMHVTENQLLLLRENDIKVENDKLELWPDELCIGLKQRLIKKDRILIALGISASHSFKCWNIEKYVDLINVLLQNDKYYFVLLGSKDAEDLLRGFSLADDTVINLVGKLNKAELISVMKVCDLYAGPDTGLAHVATALDKPSVVQFATIEESRDDFLAGPLKWGSRRRDSIVLEPQTGLDGCTKICCMNYPHCINQVSVEDMRNAIESISEKICARRYSEYGTVI